MYPKVILKRRRAKPFWFGDPWVFDGSVDHVKGGSKLADGDLVAVCDSEGRRIGLGFFNSRSVIRVRLVSWGDDGFDEAELRRRLDAAVSLRRDVLALDETTSAYRLVHAEGDGLPGLIVDRVGDFCVVQIDTLGLVRYRDAIVRHLEETLSPRGIYERVSRTAREQEGLERDDGLLAGEEPEGPVEVVESGVRHLVDLRLGQKTGFYADQRDNRLALARFSRGRRVLDAFSYAGAFGLTLLRHGAAAGVLAVDSSRPALELAERNAALNSLDRFETRRGNVLRVLDHMHKEGERFDLVVLDPPKLVPRKADLRRGLKLYHEINMKGLRVLEPGGILATCSCSQAVSEADFDETVTAAARDAGATLQLLHVGGQGPDHPALIPHRTSRYLKFVVYRVA